MLGIRNIVVFGHTDYGRTEAVRAPDSVATAADTAAPLETLPQSYVIINDPPGAAHITTGEERAAIGGVSNAMVQLSYTHQTGQQPGLKAFPLIRGPRGVLMIWPWKSATSAC